MKLFFTWIAILVSSLVVTVVFSRAVWSCYSTYTYFNR